MANEASAQSGYRHLGYKTFWIFVLERSSAAGFVFLISIGLLWLDRSGVLGRIFTLPGAANLNNNAYIHLVISYLGAASFFGFLLAALLFGLTFFIGWLVYINYKFSLEEDALKIKRGILNKEEIAIPYRQIQDVDVRRDLLYQILGLSRLVILTAGHEEEKIKGGESEGILPAIDKDAAEKIRDELLQRANIEKVAQVDAKFTQT